MLKRATCVIRRVNIDALDGIGVLLFQGLQCQQVVAMDEHVAAFGVAITVFRVFNEDAWLDSFALIVLAYPGEFKFLWFVLGHTISFIIEFILTCSA